jgi:SAM-dependent methyltransferase
VKLYSDYDMFAWIYNKHWGDAFTSTAYKVLKRLALDRLPPKARILDLCCGTGQLAKALSLGGFDVEGIDGSSEMLRFARRNAPKCRFILADARNFEMKEPVDCVVSAFDSLNHIINIGELKGVFEHTCRALKPGSVFIFDLNMKEGFKARWRGSFGIVEDDHALVVRSGYSAKLRTGRMDITMFFLRRPHWTRSDLHLQEKAYHKAEVFSALKAVGFTKTRAYDSRNHLRLQEVGRSFFFAEKPL